MKYQEQVRQLELLAGSLQNFDSKVFIAVPKVEIIDPHQYREWWKEKEQQWMIDFNGNEEWQDGKDVWNEEARIYGMFGDFRLDHNFYRQDGSIKPIWDSDPRVIRGFKIREHFREANVASVHIFADNLEQFLKQQGIKYSRTNYKRV